MIARFYRQSPLALGGSDLEIQIRGLLSRIPGYGGLSHGKESIYISIQNTSLPYSIVRLEEPLALPVKPRYHTLIKNIASNIHGPSPASG